MKRLFVCAAISVRLFFGQAADAPAFDAASVKVHPTVDGHTSVDTGPGGIQMSNVTLRLCLTRAYRTTDPQIAGPSWIDTDRYDIVAKSPSGAPESQIPGFLQTLLADRFKLVVHRETRELPAYALVVAKNGPKLTKAEENTPGSGISSSGGTVTGTAVTMARLAGFLATPRSDLGLPVVDRTGLEGFFTFTLNWTPETRLTEKPDSKLPAADAHPPILIALQEQLGLKLEKRKASIEIVVIDRAERVPTGN